MIISHRMIINGNLHDFYLYYVFRTMILHINLCGHIENKFIKTCVNC